MCMIRFHILLTLFTLGTVHRLFERRVACSFVLWNMERCPGGNGQICLYQNERLTISDGSPFRTTDSGYLASRIRHFMIMNGFTNQLDNTRFESRCDDPSIWSERQLLEHLFSVSDSLSYLLSMLLEWYPWWILSLVVHSIWSISLLRWYTWATEVVSSSRLPTSAESERSVPSPDRIEHSERPCSAQIRRHCWMLRPYVFLGPRQHRFHR